MPCGGLQTGRSYMMDFGAVGLEALVGPENGVSSQLAFHSDSTKTKSNGSGFLKKERSGSGEEDWRSSKVARTQDADSHTTMLQQQQQGSAPLLLRSIPLLSGDGGQPQNMLSFSAPGSEAPFLCKNGGFAERSSTYPYYQHTAYAYARNAGYGSGGMNGTLVGARGPFTPSQWLELEHQALIYKYIMAKVPVPPNLIIALNKSINPYGSSGFSSGSYAPNSLGWGNSFHLGFSGSTDPEPGRCRRTDGKKWRCSRDAVPEQKYCERHINRGRHRSRKPVEGRTGQAIAGTTTNVAPFACSTAASVISSSGATSCLGTQLQFKGSQPGAENPSANVLVNRIQAPQGLSVVSPTTNLKSQDCQFSVPKQHTPVGGSSSHSEFGLVSCDSLLNLSQKSSYMNSRDYSSILDFNNPGSQQHPLRHFMDDWPKDQSSRGTIAWPEELKSDWTQLSMSIPMAASDFSSTSSSSPQEKVALSPLRLSRELEPIQTGLAASNDHSESAQKQANWIPISWGSSMGGPLGEVLNTSSNVLGACKSSSASNTTNRVSNGSPQLGSSPTGVLHKATFVSRSNSSSGSSPRGVNNRTSESRSLGDDMLGSTLASSFFIQSL